MKRFSKSIFLIGCCFIGMFFSCSKSSTSDTNAPTDLVFTAKVVGQDAQNPNGDGSGMVKFSVSAKNANYYKISLGDGTVMDINEGDYTHTYVSLGLKTYTVSVSAYTSPTSFVSKTIYLVVFSNQGAKPIWSEEFDADGTPNAKNWNFDLGAGGWGNQEVQHYTNRTDNAIVQNGVLKIIAKKESYQNANYTSARLISQNKFSFQYGRVEVRAKLPVGGGTWPAIWMLGDNITTAKWPACGEIDIMEHVGNKPNTIHGTLHYPDPANPTASLNGGAGNGKTTVISNATSEFHVYKLNWTASEITIGVDDQTYFSFPNTSITPFNQKFFFILNIAVGGKMGGTIDPAFSSGTMEIDYIRVYAN